MDPIYKYFNYSFLKHFPGLVKNGRLFVAQPPLYRIDIKGKYRKEFGKRFMCVMKMNCREGLKI